MARSKAEAPVPTTFGAGTVLPGVPLPLWARPAGPIGPEGPAFDDPEAAIAAARAEAARRMAAQGAVPATAVATPGHTGTPAPVMAAAVATAPVEVPMPPPMAAAPVQVPMPLPMAAAPVEVPMPPPMAAAPVEVPMPPPMAAAPVEVPMPPPADPALVTVGGAPAPVAHTPVEELPHRHSHRADVTPEPTPKRRLFGRKARATEPVVDAPDLPPAAPAAVATAAAVATVGGPAPMTAPVPLPPPGAPVELPPPAGAPVGLAPAPVDEIVPAAESGRRSRRASADKPAKADRPRKPSRAERRAAEAAAVAADPVAEPAATPEPRRRLGVLVLALLAVAALVGVALFVWPGLLVTTDDTAGTAPAPVPARPAGTSVTLQTPATAAGLTKIDGPLATSLQSAAKGAPLAGFTAPVTAVYGTAGKPAATVMAWTAAVPPSADTLSTAFAGVEAVTGAGAGPVSAVSPGTLGGQMRCGATTAQGQPAQICFWADSASFGAVTVLSPASPAAAAQTATALRQAVETRG